jgi:hypothetical protein
VTSARRVGMSRDSQTARPGYELPLPWCGLWDAWLLRARIEVGMRVGASSAPASNRKLFW